MRGIGACECRADGVGVLHRKIDDAGDGSLRFFRRRRDGHCGLAQPARQHFVATAVGVQRRLQWKALLGTPAGMFMNKVEPSNAAATQQPHDFGHVFTTVTGEFGQEVGISRPGEFGYFGKYRLLKLRRDGCGIVGDPVNGRSQGGTAGDHPEGVVERVDIVVGHSSDCRESTIRWHSDRTDCLMAMLQPGDNLQSAFLIHNRRIYPMAKYLFVYHGGSRPETKDAQAKVMAAWGEWFGSMGKAVINGGNPVGKSWTVKSNGSVAKDGGANPVSGYSLIEAKDYDEAAAKAKGCPLLGSGGSVEIAEAMDM
jgi:hypothetical protein